MWRGRTRVATATGSLKHVVLHARGHITHGRYLVTVSEPGRAPLLEMIVL